MGFSVPSGLLLPCVLDPVNRPEAYVDRDAPDIGPHGWTPVTELDPKVALAELEASDDGLVWVDRAGRVLFINDAASRMFGRMFIGAHVSECAEKYEVLRPDGSRCRVEDLPLYRAAIRRERVQSEHCRIRQPEGTIIDVLTAATPLDDERGEPTGAVLRMKDITEREGLARVLRLSERRFKALAAATAQMIWTADPDGLVREPSPSWKEYTGQSQEEWICHGWLDVVHPDDRERTRRAWLGAVEQKRPYEVEYRVRRHDGVYRWTVARGAPILADDGAIHEWVGCNWDIHSLKEAEEEQARTVRLLRTLLAVIGHDLRNPLSSVLVGAALLQRSASDVALRSSAARITRGAERAASILDVLLDLTSAQLGGGIPLQTAEADLAELAAEIVAECEGQAAGRRLSVENELSARGVFDRTRMGQVIANLVSNAIHHGSPGTPVLVRVRCDGEALCLEVENQAPPIPAEQLATLFDPFKSSVQMPAEGRRNLGLGLYIVDQIVKAHGGTVRAESNPARTLLTVRIPRKRAD
jgi:PAS domain S-box-containing protein